MSVSITFVVIIALYVITNGERSNAYNPKLSDNQGLIDAGCSYDMCGGRCDAPRIKGYGYLLQKGACVVDTYSKSIVPEKGNTKAYTRIINETIRDVDSKKKEMLIDITLTMLWVDPRIKTNFSSEDVQDRQIPLELEELSTIWKPDLYIYYNSDYKSFSDSKQIKTFRLLPFNESSLSTLEPRPQSIETVVEYTIEAKAKIYCNFDLASYPMDKQVCQIRFGSRSSGTTFRLDDPFDKARDRDRYQAANFEIEITHFDGGDDSGDNLIGFDIKLARILDPYIMGYYLPCIASVVVSQIGFLIPLTSIPGRAALLVTQFLSLINLFIAEMADSPAESEMTALGIYVLSSLTFAFAALIEFAFVVAIHRIEGTNKRKIEPQMNKVPCIKKDLLSGGIRLRKNIRPRSNYWAKKKGPDNEREKLMDLTLLSTDKIDFLSFWSFLFAYILFNVFYWVSYLQN